MWRIIKAEIKREKYLWFLICVPLLLLFPFSLYFGEEALKDAQTLSIISKLSKGLTIVFGLIIMRSILGYLGNGSLCRLPMRLPVSLLYLAIVRIGNAFSLLTCTFVLIFLNLHALPAQIKAPLFPILFISAGAVMCFFGAMIVISDLLNIWFRIDSSRQFAALLFVILGPILLLAKRGTIAPFLTPFNIILLNLLGLTLLSLSIYTFTHLRSYIFKLQT